MSKKDPEESKEATNIRPDVAAMAARLGLIPTTTREERARADVNMHYVGFGDATLLRTEHNPNIQMYTNGIIGCNALVMSSPQGTYMAHINVKILKKVSIQEMSSHTTKTIQEFTNKIEKPRIAYIITQDGYIHPGLESALRANDIPCNIYRASQFSIKVGNWEGSLEINSNFSRPNPVCQKNNLLPEDLQWEAIRVRQARSASAANPLHAGEADRMANARRQVLQEHRFARPQLYDDGTGLQGLHYMKHTVSSLAKRHDSVDASEQAAPRRQNLQENNIARPQLYNDGTGILAPHYMKHTASSLAKRRRNSHNRTPSR